MVVVDARAVVHDDEVTLLDHIAAGTRVRVGAVGPGGDDGLEAQGVGAVGEHVGLQLHADLLLRHAGLDEAANVGEGLVGNALGGTEFDELLGILDGAHVHQLAVQAGKQRGEACGLELHERLVIGAQVHRGLDGHDARAALAYPGGDPRRGVDDVLVHLPAELGHAALDEGVVVARVGVQPQALGGHERSVGDLVVKGTSGAREPTQVGVVAQDDRVIAALGHKLAQARDAALDDVDRCHVMLLSLRGGPQDGVRNSDGHRRPAAGVS